MVEGAHPVWFDGCGQFGLSNRFFCVGWRETRRSCHWQLMESPFELSFGRIAGQTYLCWSELTGSHLGV